MKTKKLNCIYLTLISLVFSSSGHLSMRDKIIFTKFPSSEQVVLKNLFPVGLQSVSDIQLTDSTILFKNRDGGATSFIMNMICPAKC